MSPIYVPGKVVLAKEFTWNETVWNPTFDSAVSWYNTVDSSKITLTSGRVTSFQDGGSGNNVLTSATGPTLVSDSGFNALRYTGSLGQQLIKTSATGMMSGTTGATFVYLVKLTASQTNKEILAVGLGSAGPRYGVFTDTSNPVKPGVEFAGSAQYSSTGIADSQWHIVAVSFSTSTLLHRINGSDAGTGTGVNVSMTTTPSITIGGGPPNVGLVPSADIGPVVIYSGAVSTLTLQKTEGWIAHVTGQTSVLASGHPYKTVGPTP